MWYRLQGQQGSSWSLSISHWQPRLTAMHWRCRPQVLLRVMSPWLLLHVPPPTRRWSLRQTGANHRPPVHHRPGVRHSLWARKRLHDGLGCLYDVWQGENSRCHRQCVYISDKTSLHQSVSGRKIVLGEMDTFYRHFWDAEEFQWMWEFD